MTDEKREPYHHGDLRTALLEAAIEMIAEDGLESLTLRALGRRIGVSRTAPYRHFADKSALLATVSEEGFKMLGDALKAVQAQDNTEAIIMLQQMGFAYIQFALDNPTHYRLMFGGHVDNTSPEIATAGQPVFDSLVANIQQCQDEGKIKAIPAHTLAYVIWSAVHGLSALIIDNQVNPVLHIDELTQLTIQTIIDGIAI